MVVPTVDVLIVAGLQVPEIAGILVEAEGKAGGVEPTHNDPI